MEDVAADRHEPHNINPNRPALTRRQDISVLQKENMKRLLAIMMLGTFAGCTKPPQMVEPPRQTQQEILTQLKEDLAKASVVVQERKVDLDVEWMTHSSARMCSRPLDVSLDDTHLGAFVHPIQSLTPMTGLSIKDVAVAFGNIVEAYLKEKQIPETHIQTGDDIGNYMEENKEQKSGHISK